MKRERPQTTKMRERAKALRERDMTAEEIGEKLLVSKQRVCQLLGRIGYSVSAKRARERCAKARNELARELRKIGPVHTAEAMRRLGVCFQTVKSLGVPIEKYDGTLESTREIIRLYNEGVMLCEIADRLGMTVNAVGVRLVYYRRKGLVGSRYKVVNGRRVSKYARSGGGK